MGSDNNGFRAAPSHRHPSLGCLQNSFNTLLRGLLLYAGATAVVEAQEIRARELADLSLIELSNVRVSSVSRTEESLNDAAAAVAVVSSNDIRRSGATTVPEALRTVPGIHVARQNANTWAVSARGFASANSRNLLVLSDTRSIYTPLFSGVFWDVQDYLMDDIERIEVVRGPGAALWGSNAVNGVVSVTTKRAQDTQGIYGEAVAGNEESGAALRYGGKTDGDVYYRVFAKHSEHDDSFAPDAQSSDDWHISHLGFRTDWGREEDNAFTVQGDVYEGRVGQLVPAIRVIGRPGPQGALEVDVSGGNLLGRWKHRISEGSDVQLRAYYDRTHRDDPSFTDTLETSDIELEHRLEIGQQHEVLWGVNYRLTLNENRSKGIFVVEPEKSEDELISMFIQDQIQLLDNLQVTLGTKLERNDFSGSEVQPSVRVAWNPAPRHTSWAAISRAVRVPTRYERDVAIDIGAGPNGEIIRLVGNPYFESETMIAYEIGHRWLAMDNLSLDLAAFYNRYDDVSSLEIGDPFVEEGGQVVIPLIATNLSDGHSQGLEALINFAPVDYWRLTMSYSFVDMDINAPGMDVNFDRLIEGSAPRHQINLKSALDWRGYQVDVQLRHHSEIQSIPEIRTGETIPNYTELDMRVARRIGRHTEISLVGQNLLDSQHAEFGEASTRGEVERSVYAKIAVNF